LDRDRQRQDQLAGPGGDDHAAQHHAGARAGEDLDEAVADAAHLGPRVGGERQLHHPGGDLAAVHRGLRDAHRGDLRVGEDGGRHVAEPDRLHRLAEGVPHRDAALHGGHGGEHQHARAVAGRVHAPRRRPRHPVDLDEPARVEVDPGLDQADPVGGRRHAHGEQAVRAGHLPAVGERDDHAVALAVHRLGAGLAEHVHAAPPEDALDDHGGVLVLVRQDALTGRHQRDLRAERLVGAGELGAGDAGADHDQLFRQLGQVVELAAGQDALAVRHRVGQRPGARPGRDEHDVGLDRRPARGDRVRPGQPSPGLDDAHALAADMLGDVVGLRGCQGLDPRVERGGVHLDHGVSAARELQAEGGGTAERGHGRRRLDQRLARDTVRKHAGAAKAVLVDDGYVGTQLRGDESGLVAAGAAAADSDIRTRQGHVKQLSRMPASALARGDAPCTPCTRLVNAKAAWYPPFRVYPVRLGSVALYAAYGSNMDPAQMLLRCPHSPQRGTGWLEGWRLSFGGEDLGWDGALTTVVEDPAQRVFVALYDVPEIDEKELDSWDGVNLGFYSKIKVRVQTLDGDALAW